MVALHPAFRIAFPLALLASVLGCHEDRLTTAPCQQDSDCEAGLLCESEVCIDASTKSCDVVTEGNPILQPSPHVVSFGDLDVPEATQVVSLHNLGNCTLTVFEAALGDGTPFQCDLCAGRFPIEIFPGRKKDLTVTFKPAEVGAFATSLEIISDDREFPELNVPVRANFIGVPDLRVAPNPVDFGYVAQGRVLKRKVQATNLGTGEARITIHSVKLEPAGQQDFELTQPPSQPVALPPLMGDPAAILSLEVQYHPRSLAKHQAALVLSTNKGDVSVPLLGNAETPPKLNVSPDRIDLGAVPLGQSNHQTLTLVNDGGAPLTVSYLWGGTKPSTDLFATPAVLLSIAPGQYLEMEVSVTATTLGPISGLLVLSSNDPARPSMTIPVSATGVPGAGPEVVKIEMNLENGSDSAFDSDLRNVDLTLEHPYGYICNKQNPAPKNWGAYGNPSWIFFPPKEEPERIVLADATQDGTYRVMIGYQEDCKSLPTELTAGLIGISTDVLVDSLSKGLVNINGKDVGELIAKTCLDHGGSNVTVRVSVNGSVRGERTVKLNKKGDNAYVLDLVRTGGTFTIQ